MKSLIKNSAFHIALLVFHFCCCNQMIAAAQEKVPKFKDYPVKTTYRGKNAALLLTRDSRTFKTRLKQALKGKPNFAGHYIVTSWGCGTGCEVGAIIDAKTGKTYFFPFPIGQDNEVDEDFRPIEFRLGSKLIIFSGFRVDKDEDAGARFYKFENGQFKFLKFIKRPGN